MDGAQIKDAINDIVSLQRCLFDRVTALAEQTGISVWLTCSRFGVDAQVVSGLTDLVCALNGSDDKVAPRIDSNGERTTMSAVYRGHVFRQMANADGTFNGAERVTDISVKNEGEEQHGES